MLLFKVHVLVRAFTQGDYDIHLLKRIEMPKLRDEHLNLSCCFFSCSSSFVFWCLGDDGGVRGDRGGRVYVDGLNSATVRDHQAGVSASL